MITHEEYVCGCWNCAFSDECRAEYRSRCDNYDEEQFEPDPDEEWDSGKYW